MNAENQADTASLMNLSGRAGIGSDGDCGRELEIVKARGAALIRERMLSERSEFFLFRIAFSRITGLLLSLIPCNRNRKHYNPDCSEYIRHYTVSE